MNQQDGEDRAGGPRDMRILAMSVPEPNDTSAEAQFDARPNAGGGGCGP